MECGLSCFKHFQLSILCSLGSPVGSGPAVSGCLKVGRKEAAPAPLDLFLPFGRAGGENTCPGLFRLV